MEIKSKIEARQEALSLAVTMASHRAEITENAIITLAKLFEEYIIGGAELPEQPEDSNKMLKDYLDKMSDAILKREKPSDYGIRGFAGDISS